jgi:hypothetical protein
VSVSALLPGSDFRELQHSRNSGNYYVLPEFRSRGSGVYDSNNSALLQFGVSGVFGATA